MNSGNPPAAAGGVAMEQPGGAGREPSQGHTDLARLVARLEALATDPAKAPACRELLAKLGEYRGG